MRPAAGEIDLALEVLDAVDLRRFWRGETARGHDVVAAGGRPPTVHAQASAAQGPLPLPPPRPTAVRLWVGGEAGVDGLNVTACTGISVPVPGPADVVGLLQCHRCK